MPSGIFVYTGSERVFALGAVTPALRAAAQGDRVLLVQLLKGGIDQGPEKPRRLLEHFEWVRPEVMRVIDSKPSEAEHEAITQLWQYVLAKMGEIDLLILDEAGLAVHLGLLQETQLLDFLAAKSPTVEIVLTGPGLSEAVLALAESWTVIRTQSELAGAAGGLHPVLCEPS